MNNTTGINPGDTLTIRTAITGRTYTAIAVRVLSRRLVTVRTDAGTCEVSASRITERAEHED